VPFEQMHALGRARICGIEKRLGAAVRDRRALQARLVVRAADREERVADVAPCTQAIAGLGSGKLGGLR
jgi:hypothetical protein